jgi:hypothetical protein
MTKVLVKNFAFQALRVMNLDPTILPLDDFGVVLREHLRQLEEELSDRLRLIAVFAA